MKAEKTKDELTHHTTEGEKVAQQVTFLKVWGKIHGKETKKTREIIQDTTDDPKDS